MGKVPLIPASFSLLTTSESQATSFVSLGYSQNQEQGFPGGRGPLSSPPSQFWVLLGSAHGRKLLDTVRFKPLGSMAAGDGAGDWIASALGWLRSCWCALAQDSEATCASSRAWAHSSCSHTMLLKGLSHIPRHLSHRQVLGESRVPLLKATFHAISSQLHRHPGVKLGMAS